MDASTRASSFSHRQALALRKALVAAAIALPLSAPLAVAADGDGQQSFVATQDSYTLVWGVGVVHSPAPAVDPAGANARYVTPLATYTAPQAAIVEQPVVVVVPGDTTSLAPVAPPAPASPPPPAYLATPGYVYPPVGAGWVVPNEARSLPDVDGPASLKGD